MEKKLSIQVYTVRDMITDEASINRVFKELASYGYTGIQTAGMYDLPVETYAAAAKAANLEVVGTHDNLSLFDNIEEAVRFHQVLGTTNAGIGGYGEFMQATTQEPVLAFAEKANRIGEALRPYGMKFTYHHHSFEFAKVGGETIMDILVRELNPETTSFVLDTCWLQHGSVSVTEWIRKLAGRVDILHLKDRGVKNGTNDGYITELGNGNINFKEVLRAAEDAGVQYYCYEQDSNFAVDPMDSAKRSAEYFFSLL